MRETINDVLAFIAVATDRSFTHAAARLGVSQSSLSRTIRKLEERLGVRLLTRTTRSVSLTEAGERLLSSAAPRLDEIEAELVALRDLRDRPAGTVRITASEYAAETVLWPKLANGLRDYPDIRIEIVSDNGFVDIAAQGLDAGIRLGESVEKDMIAIRIGVDQRLVPVASPAYFETHPVPATPQDLVGQSCINLRMVSSGVIYAWEFERDRRPLRGQGRRPADVQFHQAGRGRRPGGIWNCLRTGAGGGGPGGGWTAGAGARRPGASQCRAFTSTIPTAARIRRRSRSWQICCGTGGRRASVSRKLPLSGFAVSPCQHGAKFCFGKRVG